MTTNRNSVYYNQIVFCLKDNIGTSLYKATFKQIITRDLSNQQKFYL